LGGFCFVFVVRAVENPWAACHAKTVVVMVCKTKEEKKKERGVV
jgi:hypothetical protein